MMDTRNCGFCQKCAEGLYDKCETFPVNHSAMTDIIEVAKACGAQTDRARNRIGKDGGAIFTTDQLQAFADHYRKEGAEEANKTIEKYQHDFEVSVADHEKCKGYADYLREQLAATELVVEQMRADFKEVLRISDRKHDAWDKAKQALQLQPSLSALREKVKEGRKNRDSVVQCKTCKYNITEYEIVYCHSCCHVASELRAKGEQ